MKKHHFFKLRKQESFYFQSNRLHHNLANTVGMPADPQGELIMELIESFLTNASPALLVFLFVGFTGALLNHIFNKQAKSRHHTATDAYEEHRNGVDNDVVSNPDYFWHPANVLYDSDDDCSDDIFSDTDRAV